MARGKTQTLNGFSKTHFSRTRVEFPLARMRRFLKKSLYAERVTEEAAVYLAAVLESVTADVIDLAGEAARNHKEAYIKPNHLPFSSPPS